MGVCMEEHAIAPWDPSREDCVWNLLTNPKSAPVMRIYESRKWISKKSEEVWWKGYEAVSKSGERIEETSAIKLMRRLGYGRSNMLFNMDFGEKRRISSRGEEWIVERVRKRVRREA